MRSVPIRPQVHHLEAGGEVRVTGSSRRLEAGVAPEVSLLEAGPGLQPAENLQLLTNQNTDKVLTDQSEASILVTRFVLTNQRPVFLSRGLS